MKKIYLFNLLMGALACLALWLLVSGWIYKTIFALPLFALIVGLIFVLDYMKFLLKVKKIRRNTLDLYERAE